MHGPLTGQRTRPTRALRDAQERARPADEVLDPVELGAGRHTRHSFARSFLRAAARGRWAAHREHWSIDRDGRGEAVYRVDLGGPVVRLVVFSTTIAESDRTDRVVAESWDVTAALVQGELSDARWAELRAQVPRQELGRADAATLVWTRANRSARFFDYVVDELATGRQPDPAVLGDGAYVLRSTAFYSNGKLGLAEFDRLGDEHPLGVPYRAQMLTAWLLRELSIDLVEHCAAVRAADHGATAARLDGAWRRHLGLGNATGLGMVPYVVNHPHVLDAWCALRELPLARALAGATSPGGPDTERVAQLLDRAREYFRERDGLATSPYRSGPELADGLDRIAGLLREYRTAGTVGSVPTERAWRALRDAAHRIDPEVAGVLDTVLVELDDTLDQDVERLLVCDRVTQPDPGQSCAGLRATAEDRYGWVRRFDFTDPGQQAWFWFSSQNNEEPRRGRRGHDPGEDVEHPLDVARAVRALLDDLAGAPGDCTVAEFLLGHPWHRGAVARVQCLADVVYGEVRANLLAADFLPLHLQRFQLAVYGMESFSPRSTDWLRVTLFSGAPRAADVAAGLDDDWIFPRKPRQETTCPPPSTPA